MMFHCCRQRCDSLREVPIAISYTEPIALVRSNSLHGHKTE